MGLFTPRKLAPAVAALLVGLGLAWIDARPGFDDTGILVGLVFLAGLLFAALGAPMILAALAVAGPIVAHDLPAEPGVLLALLPALAGVAAGGLVRRARIAA